MAVFNPCPVDPGLAHLTMAQMVALELSQVLPPDADFRAFDNFTHTSELQKAQETPLSNHSSGALLLQACAVINVQQMDHPDDRKKQAHLEEDPIYEENYKKWRIFLVEYAGAGHKICDILGPRFLRSLLIVNGSRMAQLFDKIPDFPYGRTILKNLSQKLKIDQEFFEKMLAMDPFDKPAPESMLCAETGLGYVARDTGGAKEEQMGIITFRCITNDRQPGNMVNLISLKNIFARQLPKMPREYISRLVFDRNHFSFCLMKKKKLCGGVCFRPCFTQKFAEIAFLAISSSEQVKGYGTRLMNHLKEHVKKVGIEYFLTYADNSAIGYFRKQGFSNKLEMPKERWYGYIKDYDGGTLMECFINPRVNYLRLSEKLVDQRRSIRQIINLLSPPKVYEGLTDWDGKPKNPSTVSGLVEAGWKTEPPRETKSLKSLKEQIVSVVDILKNHENSWPFRVPVQVSEAPDYYNVIKEPMDIQTIRIKANRSEYKSKEEFGHDVTLMFGNCKIYNHPSTIYYKFAVELESFVKPKIAAIDCQ